MKMKLNLTLYLKMSLKILILVITIVQCSAAELYDQDPFNYSSDNSADSESNEMYNNININDNNSDETVPKVEKTRGTTTAAPIANIVKASFVPIEESTENTESAYNGDLEVSTHSAQTVQTPAESLQETEELHHPVTVNNLTIRVESSTAKPPGHFQDCKDKQYHTPEKSEEDKCTSTLVNYPFSVSLQKKGAHYASGALLDKRWILSVATEFYNVRESLKIFRARLGSVDCKKGGTLVPLKRVEIHPSYIYGQPNFDLALLRMAQPVDYTDYIRPIGLSNIRTKVISAKFMTTYWPRLIVRGKVLPSTAKERIKQNSMRVSTQRLVPQDKCIFHLQKQNVTLDESTLCLKPVVTHHSPCMPDAGAPVVAEDGLWGITSGWISRECYQRPSPTVFSRLSSLNVRSWLDTQLLTI